MQTEVLRIEGNGIEGNGFEDNGEFGPAINRAAEFLATGKLVAFPTETVYGLGANVADPDALARLRSVKQRSDSKPFTVHVPRKETVDLYVPEISRIGRRFIEKAWPGPLTLLFHVETPERARVIQNLGPEHTSEIYFDQAVGIRCPEDPVASALLNEAGVSVVATSANPAGDPAPVTADEVLEKLDGKIDLLLDAGQTRYAKASTIVRLNGDGYELVREGVWDERTLRRFTKTLILFVCTGNTCRSPMAEGLCKSMIAQKIGCDIEDLEQHGFVVLSAGVMAMSGCRASPNAVQILREQGIDLARHTSQPVTVELVNQADYIYAMTDAHRESVSALVPSRTEQIVALRTDGDIQDPIGTNEEVYRRCARSIEEAIRQRLEELTV